jgi:WhiB family redox-sensing transcriptional regulator
MPGKSAGRRLPTGPAQSSGIDIDSPAKLSITSLLDSQGHEEWHTQGECRTMDQSLFFPAADLDGHARLNQERLAKSICETCPVKDPCREFALAGSESYGIWGGTTPTERLRIARRRRRYRVVGVQ